VRQYSTEAERNHESMGTASEHMNQFDYCYVCKHPIVEPEGAIILFPGERSSRNELPKFYAAVHKTPATKATVQGRWR